MVLSLGLCPEEFKEQNPLTADFQAGLFDFVLNERFEAY